MYTHTYSKAQRLGPIKIQDTAEQSVCWCNGLEWSQLGLGKHAHSLALITEALNLSSTHTHTKTHTNIQTEIQIHTLSPETDAGLNYRLPDRAYLLRNGGCWQRTVSVAKNTNTESDHEKVIETMEKEKKKGKESSEGLKRLSPGSVSLSLFTSK